MFVMLPAGRRASSSFGSAKHDKSLINMCMLRGLWEALRDYATIAMMSRTQVIRQQHDGGIRSEPPSAIEEEGEDSFHSIPTTSMAATNFNYRYKPPVRTNSNIINPVMPPPPPTSQRITMMTKVSTLPSAISEESLTLSRTISAQSLPVSTGSSAFQLPYDRVLYQLAHDPNCQKDVSLGRRIGFYKLGKELGQGNFSKVKLGVHVLTNEKVAVKIMEKSKMDPKAQRLLESEIDSMENMHHPNIIRLFECVETLSRTYLVMEYAGGGELYDYINARGKITETEAKPIFAQLVSAVSHMNMCEFLLRFTLKLTFWTLGLFTAFTTLENISFQNDVFTEALRGGLMVLWKGCAIKYDQMMTLERHSTSRHQSGKCDICSTRVGKTSRLWLLLSMYQKPDAQHFLWLASVRGTRTFPRTDAEAFQEYSGQKVDIWALGVLLYYLLVGTMPFKADTIFDLKNTIIKGEYRTPEYISTFAAHMIARMLDMNPSTRIHVDEMKKTYWLSGNRFPKSYIQCSLEPNPEELEKSEVARKVWCQLNEYGITGEMMQEAAPRGARNAIIGTYRIVLYQAQAVEHDQERIKVNDHIERQAQRARQATKQQLKTRSKTCSVL
uniref:non-specific serine/threonine protein kinase n=1 Tax=Steinernema glaseri TaxID=37863 RepID=A0A1I8AB50_9BILA